MQIYRKANTRQLQNDEDSQGLKKTLYLTIPVLTHLWEETYQNLGLRIGLETFTHSEPFAQSPGTQPVAPATRLPPPPPRSRFLTLPNKTNVRNI